MPAPVMPPPMMIKSQVFGKFCKFIGYSSPRPPNSCLSSPVSHPSSDLCHLISAICHPSSAICPPSSIIHHPSSVPRFLFSVLCSIRQQFPGIHMVPRIEMVKHFF
jgi:hypothetical protein